MTATPATLLLAIIIAYVAGSIPSAYIAGRLYGVDLTKRGSGNLGATNVVRVLGARAGAVVFAVDTLKGFLPVFFIPRFVVTAHPELFAVALGIAAVLGHVRPVFLLWRAGGKGVATAAGVFFALAPLAMGIVFTVWVVVFGASRYVSLASICAAIALPGAIVLTGHKPASVLFEAGAAVALFVIFTHRGNIRRLRTGKEHRFERGEKSRAQSSDNPAVNAAGER